MEKSDACTDGIRIWRMVLAAFACLHMVAFQAHFNCWKREAMSDCRRSSWDYLCASVVFFWLLYSAGIVLTAEYGLSLLDSEDKIVKQAWEFAMGGRLAAVFVLSLTVFLALFGSPIDRENRDVANS